MRIFFLSALGIAISGTKPALWLWAAFAHALLVINYALIFISAKNDDPEGYKWPSEVVTLAMVVAFYFSPWLVAWGVVLAKAKSGKSVVRVQNQAAEQNQPSQKYADEIKQKY